MFGCIPLFLPGEKPSISEILFPAFLFFWAPIFVWDAVGLKENIFTYIFLGIWWLFLAKILCFLFEKIKNLKVIFQFSFLLL